MLKMKKYFNYYYSIILKDRVIVSILLLFFTSIYFLVFFLVFRKISISFIFLPSSSMLTLLRNNSIYSICFITLT